MEIGIGPVEIVSLGLLMALLLAAVLATRRRKLGTGGAPLHGAQPAARLVAIAGPLEKRAFALAAQVSYLGRAQENRVVIPGYTVSRRHAQINMQGGQCVITDLDSTNGTFVNGQRIPANAGVPLHNSDQVQIGNCVFVYQGPGAPTPPPAPIVRQAPPVPPERPPAVAPVLSDYTLTTIGSGGAATVYKGVSRVDGHVVAVKVLRRDDPYLLKHFELEARIQQSLVHPHIIHVRSFSRLEGFGYYIVMDYADGGNLRRRMTPSQPMALDIAVRLIGEACEALDYAHRSQVVHRDIKPENILLSEREGVKIVDFGIARLAGAVTETTDGMLVGTPAYMSPEQCKGDVVDHRTDIYALGIVLYELLTGQVPFSGEPLAIIEQHIARQPVPPRRLNVAIPKDVEAAIMRCLEKHPSRRFASAVELTAVLHYVPVNAAAPAPTPGRNTTQGQPDRRSIQPGGPAAVAPLRTPTPQPGALAYLLLEGAGLPSSCISINGQMTVLGRENVNRDDQLISRSHARIRVEQGRFLLEDMGSRNGTWLNQRRINGTAPLGAGDVITIGSTRLYFRTR